MQERESEVFQTREDGQRFWVEGQDRAIHPSITGLLGDARLTDSILENEERRSERGFP